MISINDRTPSFLFRSFDCHDQPAPFTSGKYSQISLTLLDHLFNDIDKRFLTFHVKLNLSLNSDMSKMNRIDDSKTCISYLPASNHQISCLTENRF